MKKNSKRIIVVLAIILAVFTIIAFVVPFKKNVVFAMAYIFGVIAIAYQLYILQISFNHGDDAKSKFYGFPIARIGVYYLVCQLILSIVEMALAKLMPLWVVVVFDVLILAIVLIGCITAEIMRDEIEKQDDELKVSVANMRKLQSLSSMIAGMCEDEGTKAKLNNLAEEIKYSDPVSSKSTERIEIDLLTQVKEIQAAVIDKDYESVKKLSDRVLLGLKERNLLCAESK